MGRRLSLTAITRDKGDSPSSSGLERHQGSHVDGIQRSNRYIFLNKLFSPIQDRRTDSTNSHRARSSSILRNSAMKDCSDKSPPRLRLDKPDSNSTGVSAEDRNSWRRNNCLTWREPGSLMYRLTRALVSK